MKSQNTLSGAKLGLMAAFVGTLVIGAASALPRPHTPDELINTHIASVHQSGAPGFVEDIMQP